MGGPQPPKPPCSEAYARDKEFADTRVDMDETQTISPKRNEIQRKLDLTNDILDALYHKRCMGLLSENVRKELKKNHVILSSLKKDMKKRLQNVMRQKKQRTMTQAKLKSLKHESSQMSSSIDNYIFQ